MENFSRLSMAFSRKLSRAKTGSSVSAGSFGDSLHEESTADTVNQAKQETLKEVEVDEQQPFQEVKRAGLKSTLKSRRNRRNRKKSMSKAVSSNLRVSMNRVKQSVAGGVNSLQQIVQKRQLARKIKARERTKSNIEQNEAPLQNKTGYNMKKATGLVQPLGASFKKMRQRTAVLSQNFRLRKKTRAESDIDMRSRGESRMDFQAQHAYRDIKRHGKVQTLEDAEVVINYMKEHKNVSQVIAIGCASLASLAFQEALALINLDVMDLVVESMVTFKSSPSVNRNACLLIWNILVDEQAKLKLLPQKAGERPEKDLHLEHVIVDCMERHKANLKVLPKCCGTVKLLLSNPYSKAELVSLGVMDALMTSFHLFCKEKPSSPDLQTICISCIQNLAYSTNYKTEAKAQTQIVEQLFKVSAPHMVIRSMKKFTDIPELQSAGCAALWNISIPSEFKSDLVEIGGANCALKAMVIGKEDAEIVIHAFGALKNMVSGSNSEDLTKKVREKVHGPIGVASLGKINIYDIIFDAYFTHQETDSNISRIGEDLLLSFDVEDVEGTNRGEEEPTQDAEPNTLEEIPVPPPPKNNQSITAERHDMTKGSISFRNLSVVHDIEYDVDDPFGNLDEETDPDHLSEKPDEDISTFNL